MKNEKEIKDIIQAILSKVAARVAKDGKEATMAANMWAKGAVWMADLILGDLECDVSEKRLESLLKSMVLLDKSLVVDIHEIAKVSHIDADFSDLFEKIGKKDRNEEEACKNCNFMKKDRPDNLKMKSGHVWCRKIGREVLGSYWCKMGKWGYS